MPPSRTINIALAGATGNLGRPVLLALLEHFNVVVLSRIGSKSCNLQPHPRLTVQEVDLSSADSIAPILSASSVKVVISCVATLAMGSQNQLIDASAAAGVKCFVPAEFGMDSLNPLCRELPVCQLKVTTQEYLKEKSRTTPGFSYCGIANGLFLDWGIKEGFIINVAEHTATVYNGGNVPFSATLLSDIAKALVAVVYTHEREDMKNRILYIQSTVTTQNELIQYAKEVGGVPWELTHKDTDQEMQESMKLLETGKDIMGAMHGFSALASWTSEYGCDFSRHLDNEILGIRQMDKSEVRLLVKSFFGLK